MSKIRDVRGGSVLAEAIEALKAPGNHSPKVLRRAAAHVNGVGMHAEELDAHFGGLPHIEIKEAGRIALAETVEPQGAGRMPWPVAASPAIQKFLKDGSALTCDPKLDGWRTPGSGVLLAPAGVSARLRQVDAPPQKMSRMVTQPLAATLGLAAINHAARDDPHESFARTADILQVVAVQKTLAEVRRPFACAVLPAEEPAPFEALKLDNGAAILLQSATSLGEYHRVIPLTNDRDGRPKIVARQSVRLLQRALFAVTPDLAAMLHEVDAVPSAESFAPLTELAQEFVEAAGPQDIAPLAATLHASQTWAAAKTPS